MMYRMYTAGEKPFSMYHPVCFTSTNITTVSPNPQQHTDIHSHTPTENYTNC